MNVAKIGHSITLVTRLSCFLMHCLYIYYLTLPSDKRKTVYEMKRKNFINDLKVVLPKDDTFLEPLAQRNIEFFDQVFDEANKVT